MRLVRYVFVVIAMLVIAAALYQLYLAATTKLY